MGSRLFVLCILLHIFFPCGKSESLLVPLTIVNETDVEISSQSPVNVTVESKEDFLESIVNVTKSWITKLVVKSKALDAAQKACVVPSCPDGEERVAKRNFTPVINGCGASGFERYVNAHLPVADLEKCCNEHDICYNDCGSVKENCEDEFKTCLHNVCLASPVKVKRCLTVAKGFHTFTTRFSCVYFRDAKEEGCECAVVGEREQLSCEDGGYGENCRAKGKKIKETDDRHENST